MPRHDNTFGGGNYDADDLDEWMTLQRDWQVDAGIEPAGEEAVLAVRERAARAIQAVFDELGFPPVTDEEIEAATLGHSSHDLPDRDRAEDVLGRRPRARRAHHRPPTSRWRSIAAASPRSPSVSSACSASASRPTTCRPRP